MAITKSQAKAELARRELKRRREAGEIPIRLADDAMAALSKSREVDMGPLYEVVQAQSKMIERFISSITSIIAENKQGDIEIKPEINVEPPSVTIEKSCPNGYTAKVTRDGDGLIKSVNLVPKDGN